MALSQTSQSIDDDGDLNLGGNNNNNNDNNNNVDASISMPPTASPLRNAGNAGNAGNRGRGGRGGRGNRVISSEQAEVAGMVVDEDGIQVRRLFERFLNEFKDENGSLYYVEQLDAMEDDESNTLLLDWSHLRPNMTLTVTNSIIDTRYQQLADLIESEYYRFEPFLRTAIQNFVRQHKPNYVEQDDVNVGEQKQFYLSIRNYTNISQLRLLNTTKVGQLCSFSATVTRTTEVRPELTYGTFDCENCEMTVKNIHQQFKYTEPKRCPNNECQNTKSWRLRIDRSTFIDWQKIRGQELSQDIPAGSMPRSIDVILRGDTVERTKPGDNSTFTGTLIVVPDVASYYSRAPRMVNGRSGNNAQGGGRGGSAQDGGVSGLRSLGVRELNYKLVFLANFVELTNKNELISGLTGDLGEDTQAGAGANNTNLNENEEDGSGLNNLSEILTPQQYNEFLRMKNSPRIYERLAQSIAPNIWGHEEIKRGILLMLFGGVKKFTNDSVQLRGDINICLIGDPSTAKSQFLKYVTRILPRTIYTSGKASTAAGLTAAVMRDPETGEFGIEAGALMLADNGVCCIDEFDKMDGLDQAAIHEAMEQQTITITKAGIQATLNARASILAAANPVYGRYDKSKPLRYNVNISAPIMSRFDLFFVILDECDETTDYHVAQHIVRLHKNGGGYGGFGAMASGSGSDSNNTNNVNNNANDGGMSEDTNTTSSGMGIGGNIRSDFSFEQIQMYIRAAKTLKPKITPQAHKLLVRYYRSLRQRDQSEQKAYRITVRQLESLIRLSEALARVNGDHLVRPDYVREAGRLLSKSIISVEEPDIELLQEIEDEEDQENQQQVDNAMDMDENENENNVAGDGTEGAAGAAGAAAGEGEGEASEKNKTKTKTKKAERKVTFNYYVQMSNLIVYHIRHNEREVDDGIKQELLENEIMKEKVEVCEDEDELSREHETMRMIIDRLIEVDHILIVKKQGKDIIERVLMVHPNYDPDSRNTRNLDVPSAPTPEPVQEQVEQLEQPETDENENNNNNNNNNSNNSNTRSERTTRAQRAQRRAQGTTDVTVNTANVNSGEGDNEAGNDVTNEA